MGVLLLLADCIDFRFGWLFDSLVVWLVLYWFAGWLLGCF